MLALAEEHGVRNAQVTVLAPTGTIGFLMDVDTTGIEPELALVKYKLLAGKGEGMMKLVNQTVGSALIKLGYNVSIPDRDRGRTNLTGASSQADEIMAYIEEHDTIEGAPYLKDEHLAVFDCSFKPFNGERSLGYEGHLKMMAACQPSISGAISKTCNVPESATTEEIASIYIRGWELGLKAVAIYRDNSKRSQPLSTKEGGDAKKDKDTSVAEQNQRQRLPAEFADAVGPDGTGNRRAHRREGRLRAHPQAPARRAPLCHAQFWLPVTKATCTLVSIRRPACPARSLSRWPSRDRRSRA